MWYENCTLYPMDEYWCPTVVDPKTREQNGTDNWGYCPEHLILRPEECSENYDRVADVCVRVSPYPTLSWAEVRG